MNDPTTSQDGYVPDGMVKVSNETGTYSGSKVGSPGRPIEPCMTERFNDTVVVTNNGAQYATQGSVSCY
jgi:hypothetical protein